MKKKLAVLVGGEFREFESAWSSWAFLSTEHDFFISTWDTSCEKNPKLGIDIRESVTADRILKHIPHANINIEPDIINGDNSKKQRYHWKKLFEMANETGVDYDLVILMRPDLYIVEKKSFTSHINTLTDSSIYACHGITLLPPPTYIYVNDTLFLGKFDVVKNAILSLPDFDISKKNVHYHIAKHFVNTDTHVESLYNIIRPIVLRSSHRGKLHLSDHDKILLGQQWWDAMHVF